MVAQTAVGSSEVLRRITSGELTPEPFGPAKWLDGGVYTTVEKSAAVPDASDIVRYDAATGDRKIQVSAAQLTPPGSTKAIAIDDYAWSKDNALLLLYTNSQKVWRYKTRGDYWLLDLKTNDLHKLGGNAAPATLMFATLSPDGHRVAYVRQSNLYVEDVKSREITALTTDGSLRKPDGSGRTVINGTGDWVYEEEFNVRNGFRWSSDSSHIAYWQFDATPVRDFFLVDYTDSLYPTLTPVPYPKTGTPNSAARIGVVAAGGGPTTWMRVPGDPSDNYIARMEWAANNKELVLQHFDRPQHTLTVFLADATTGEVRPVIREHDPTWVDVVDDLKWLNDGADFLWISEQDGWRHAYVVSRDGTQKKLITPGNFDVIAVQSADEPGGFLYYTASPDNATQRYLYRSPLDGTGAAVRLTPTTQTGTHSYTVSPDAKWAFHIHSTFDTPPVTDLITLPDHTGRRTLTDNATLRQKAEPLLQAKSEFFQLALANGVSLDGYLIKPPDFDPAKRYPVLVHVYGEPAAQNVLDRWGNAQTLWNRYAATLGYVVVSFDNRGTPGPKGHEWRHIIYGGIGVLASQEQAAALKAIGRERPYLDMSRVGVWGWSGGGSMTLNLLFRSPELYQVGMAVAPMPDQRYYDTIYQERYMDSPQNNPEGYRHGSPIYYADGLRGKLLVVGGTGDDNCHFQVIEILLNKLIELGKQFDFMEYPNRTHALAEGPGTVAHFYGLLTRYLTEHLPAGGM